MISLESLIENYGYAALFLGTFLEGETILVVAGFAAHRGYLSLPLVVLVAFVGSLAGDQLWFYLGRKKGGGFLAARPNWVSRAERVRALLARHEWPIVVGFRFLYGLRNITPFVLGASGYDARRFAMLNVVGAAVWSVLVGAAGYVFGTAMELLIADVKRYERWLLALLAFAGIVAWLWRVVRNR